ncbi:MAG TPA: uroporphyrinogen-III synthase, partial [Crenalkalicoccus sp.]|nr:uroporphyrinogen-III synthase [Crenalkalicoccus sp.]
ATAARAAALGFADVRDADGDAADLAALARRELPPGARVLVAHARGQGNALVTALRAAGFRVRREVAYAMTPAPGLAPAAQSALRDGGVRAAMFLSAETALAFVRLLPDPLRPALAGVDAVAIGPAAAHALAPLPWRRVRVSLRPTLDHVLALL